MIHHVFIIDARDEIVVFRKWEQFEVDEQTVRDFANRVKETQFDLIDVIHGVKFVGMPLGRGVVVLCAEGVDDDETLMVRLRAVTEDFRQVIGYKVDYDEQGLSAGVGFELDTGSFKPTFDYAYTDFGILGDIHHFSLSVGF